MTEPASNPYLEQLLAKIRSYGKENLEDILHVAAEAINLITRANRCRIYLEDLTSGTLSCLMATGPHAQGLREQTFPINNTDYLVSRVYITQEDIRLEDQDSFPSGFARQLAERFDVAASYIFPLLHNERSIGVLCIDSSQAGQLPGDAERGELLTLLDTISPLIDRARLYHQQVVLARNVDAAKKKEAALYMVKSAVRLIDKLTLASVLVPAGGDEKGLQVLATYSKKREAKKLYEEQRLVSLGAGQSLLSRYINDQAVITDDTLLQPTYFPHLEAESLQKRYLTEEMGLKSLYLVPRYDPVTRRVICLVNYYTTEEYEFDYFERGLLEAHADMAQRVIQEIGNEHMEIQVLSEINDLLREKYEGLQPFLTRVLSKATELIGADTGSIALVREMDGQRWLMVEDRSGELVGAKSKEWLKKDIPPIRIGGPELPREERSLTGYVARTGQPRVLADTAGESGRDGFYRGITEDIASEIAVPVISDDQVIAVICLDSLEPNFFTDEHQRILMIIERMISRHLSDLQRIEKLTGEVQQLRTDVGYKDPNISSYKLGNIIGNSAKAQEVVDFIRDVTPPLFNRIALWRGGSIQEATLGLPSLLITGETGSGKEFVFNNLFSRLNEIYREKIGAGGELPVKKSNIAAYSGELTYSELFGHKRGAFTGAHADRKTQVQLLRFLDNGGFVRLGENITRYTRVLLVAATNRDLRRLIAEGHFREDLYQRLSELTIDVPSLTERREDIPDLAVHFLGRLWRIYKRPDESIEDVPMLSGEARELLAGHDYSGNIRELRSILLRALFFRKGRVIDAGIVRKALPKAEEPRDDGTLEKLTGEMARATFEQIRRGETDFWQSVYTPYSQNRITRDVVVELVELARRQGATTMPKIARVLRACDEPNGDDDQRKSFYRFKNFLYKTIKLT
ncbi:MAG: GAF domain-containing protein [Desulfuromonadales bacterium]|nr:GAF domain-containing protein [Desulfuromonadales bacterium]NIS43433.1 GAF domain-containing protein [Desulfuromonadales bacterium]